MTTEQHIRAMNAVCQDMTKLVWSVECSMLPKIERIAYHAFNEVREFFMHRASSEQSPTELGEDGEDGYDD